MGTLRKNRARGLVLSSDKWMRSQGRGTCEEKVLKMDSGTLAATKWWDNKAVTLVSSYIGKNSLLAIERYDKQSKTLTQVSCPTVVKEYNQFMGFVDELGKHFALQNISTL